jgi:hypothetical protein
MEMLWGVLLLSAFTSTDNEEYFFYTKILFAISYGSTAGLGFLEGILDCS